VVCADDKMALQHDQYLETILGAEMMTKEQISKEYSAAGEQFEEMFGFDKAVTGSADADFRISISESLIAKIKNVYIKHEALKKLDVFVRKDSIVIDGIIYFDMMELDIPFTVVTSLAVPKANIINLDVKEMKVWSEGNLPTDKILEKVVKFIDKNTKAKTVVDIKYEAVAVNKYNNYGRLVLVPHITKFVPMMPEISINKIQAVDKEVTVYGK